MANDSLKDKTVKGVGWSAIDNVAQMGVTFLVSIVLARLLSPDDYGLLGLITIVTAVCTTLVNGGFTTALIRKKDITEDDYNTAFSVNLALSLLLYAIVYASSPFIADFFKREELVSLTRVASLGLIAGALSLVPQTRLTKRIDFKAQTKITLIASVTSGVLGIAMALLGFGVWSLVAQTLSNQVLRTILLWVIDRWIPKFRFSKASFQELFGFGWKMMLSGLLDTVWKELYQVVVGKFYSPATLGQYTRGKQFSQLLSVNLNNVIQRVTFPVLSNIQDDKERMVSAYRRMIKVTMFVAAVGMLFLGAIAEPLIYCLIGPKWHDAAIYLPLICISSSSYPLQAMNLNMLQVQGRSDLYLGLEIAKKIVLMIPMFIGAFIGIMPMLYANIATSIICYFINSHYSGKLIGYSSWMQIKDVAPSYGIATLVAVSIYFLKYLPVSNWVILPIQLVLGFVVLITVCQQIRMREFIEIKGIIQPYLKKIKR